MDDLLSKNLETLRDRDPALYQVLGSYRSPGYYRCLETPSGHPTLFYSGSGHSPRFIHHPQNPVEEAELLVKPYDFRGEDITILMGFGLGYLPSAIQGRMHPDHRLFILEASPEVLRRACEAVDLTRLLTTPGIRIFFTDQTESLLRALEHEALRVLAGRVNKLVYPPLYALGQAPYETAERQIEAFIAEQKESFKTMTAHQDLVLENVLQNLTALREAAPVEGLLSGEPPGPAVVVSAGPSLDRNISILGQFRDRFLVIAVDAALMPLVHTGILPDLVVSIDPNPINGKKFDPIPPDLFSLLPLVFSPAVCPSIPRRFPGAKFVFGTPHRLCRWALSLSGGAAEFPAGYSVSQFAFYLARAMGADPIIFVGLDLALSPEGNHARHCPTAWKIGSDDPRLITVPGIDGNPVPTLPGFARMITLFEREIQETGVRCIDATEGGARIEGTDVMTLNEAVGLCPGRQDARAGRFQRLWTKNRGKSIGCTASALSVFLDSASELHGLCRSALSLLAWDWDAPASGKTPLEVSAECIARINGIADQVSAYETFLEPIKDQMGAVLVDQYRLRYELDRTTGIEERRRREIEKSYRFFSRLEQITGRVLRIGRPVLQGLHGSSRSMPNPPSHRVQVAGREER